MLIVTTSALTEKGETMSEYIMRHEYEDDEDVLTVVGELVRCKDCTYYCPLDDSRPYDCLRSGMLCVRKEDFCSCGKERR